MLPHSAVTTLEVIQLQPDDVARVPDVLPEAFRHDILWRYFVPDETQRVSYLRHLQRYSLQNAARAGTAYTTPQYDGIAIWQPPGHTEIDSWESLQGGALPMMLRLLRAVGPGRIPAYLNFIRYADARQKAIIPGDHWYLASIGVHPNSQGKGIGGQLMRPVLERADANRLPCYLETSTERHVTFFQQQGFEVVSDDIVPGIGLRLWTMVRKPH